MPVTYRQWPAALLLALLATGHLSAVCVARGMLGPQDSLTDVVHTSEGPVRGVQRWSSNPQIESFFGIPFAKPPIGDLRFAPPQSLTESDKRTGLLHAIDHPKVCAQLRLTQPFDSYLGDEDCLQLHIHRPQGTTAADRLPVMVWLFGGGFFVGDAWMWGTYDPARLVEDHKVIVVAMNYRLGLLGFLASEELKEENGSAGNMAMQDQREALRWVKKNIEHFGGNPGKVLLFGESAGAMSALWHLVSPVSKEENLFSAVVLQSPSDTPFFFHGWREASQFCTELGKSILEESELDCDPRDSLLSCLRRVPVNNLILGSSDFLHVFMAHQFGMDYKDKHVGEVNGFFPLIAFGIAVDGSREGLLGNPWDLLKAGEMHDVPVLVTSNLDEGTLFSKLLPSMIPQTLVPGKTTTMSALKWIIDDEFTMRKTYDLYRPYVAEGAWEVMASRWIRDSLFQSAAQRIAEAISHKNKTSAWLASYSSTPAALIEKTMGNMHALEISLVFQSEMWFGSVSPEGTGARRSAGELSAYMKCLWASMASCGKPTCSAASSQRCPGVPSMLKEEMDAWKPYTSTRREYLSLRRDAHNHQVPHVRSIPDEVSYDPSDRYSDEWVSRDRFDLHTEVFLGRRWKKLPEDAKRVASAPNWWDMPGNFLNGSAVAAWNAYHAPETTAAAPEDQPLKFRAEAHASAAVSPPSPLLAACFLGMLWAVLGCSQ